jgi:hypothetical protein
LILKNEMSPTASSNASASFGMISIGPRMNTTSASDLIAAPDHVDLLRNIFLLSSVLFGNDGGPAIPPDNYRSCKDDGEGPRQQQW